MTDAGDVFTTLIKPNLPLFGAVAGLYAVLFLYRRFKPALRGTLREMLVVQGTFRLLKPEGYGCFTDVRVPRPDGGGTLRVDHVVVSPHGIFVIETKPCTGAVQGAEDEAQWVQTFATGSRVAFPNLIWQSRRHIAALAQFLKLPEAKFRPVIFLMGGGTLKPGLPEPVINDGLTAYITGFEEVVLEPAEVERVKAALGGK
ncbi:nuclease-related domain-containing protein [Prosthecobacter sp.]|uniref:nuclease-related domain-containing protein n=1 Tax=Prosthecobacter sp. TaxID=1965333 RepID=UPI003784046F